MTPVLQTAGDVLVGLIPCGGWVAIVFTITTLYQSVRGTT